MDFELPVAMRERLAAVSTPVPGYPYTFFTPGMQTMLLGAAPLGDKADGYQAPARISGPAAGVQ